MDRNNLKRRFVKLWPLGAPFPPSAPWIACLGTRKQVWLGLTVLYGIPVGAKGTCGGGCEHAGQ